MKKMLLCITALMALIFSCSGYAYLGQVVFTNQVIGAQSVNITDLHETANGDSATLQLRSSDFNLRTNQLKVEPILPASKGNSEAKEDMFKIEIMDSSGQTQYEIDRVIFTNNPPIGSYVVALNGRNYKYMCLLPFVNGLTNVTRVISGNNITLSGTV